MISVQIHGGLGNQLFQYAFVYAASRKLNTNFYLDESIDLFKCGQYFNIKEAKTRVWLRRVYRLKGMHKLLSKIKLTYFKSLSGKHRLININLDQSLPAEKELTKLRDNALFIGFFQSESYFKAQREELLARFEIKKSYQQAFKKSLEKLNGSQKLVCVHIRRGDYLQHQLDLPLNYYKEAIALISHPNNHYVFISDDPLFVTQNFAEIENKTVSTENEIIDFQYLTNSNINILSNSSFSWWGAYLNKNNAFTIAPKNWLGKTEQYPLNITLKRWKLI
ncbi:alpha-1,2-fucosyltransferase [Nubsella zeaxanthinifaciens]|uniref:alpha-1,2-fucosyltransferase n=1 Tax=Nubsella zeaxanthinifaciens TaxID=392412 RepID=UPI003CFDE718